MAAVLISLPVLGRFQSSILQAFVLVSTSLIVSLLVIEVLAKVGLLDFNYNWISEKDATQIADLNAPHLERSSLNPFHFNDIVHEEEKPERSRRIAIVGDSFVWGAALPLEFRWSTRLELKLKEKNADITVLHWAKSGWSTLEQVEFLEKYGAKYKPDIIPLTFVTNDPNLGDVPFQVLSWQDSPCLTPIKIIFPDALRYVSGIVNTYIYQNSENLGYENWKNALYSDSNLSRYSKILERLTTFQEAVGIPIFYVLTPNNHSQYFAMRYSQIIPLFERVGIEYLNLLPSVQRRLGNYSIQSLKAHRADGHPGPFMTELFADEVFSYLNDRYSAIIRPRGQ